MFSVSANYNISLTTPQLARKQNWLLFLRTLYLDLSLDLIFKVTVSRDTTLTHNISCHFTLPHNQKVTVFASSKDEKDRKNEMIISGNLPRTKQFLLQKRMHDSFHRSSMPSTARENLNSVITKAIFSTQKAKQSPGGSLQRSSWRQFTRVLRAARTLTRVWTGPPDFWKSWMNKGVRMLR